MNLSALRAHVPEGVGYYLDSMLVVSAYAGPDFFKSVDSKLSPKRLGVLLDEGVSEAVFDAIRKPSCVDPSRWKHGGGIACARRSSERMMHAKVYVLSWVAPGKRTINVIAVGSANASRAAWSGKSGNGEALVVTRFLKRHDEVCRWVSLAWERLRDGEGTVPPLSSADVDGVSVSVDGFEVVPINRPSFDAWLEQGILCHPYDPDPGFLRISVPLKKPLPPNPSLHQLGDLRLLDDRAGSFLRFSYLDDELPPKAARSKPDGAWKWRSRFFVDTTLGHWTSRRCYVSHKAKFVAGGHLLRRRELELIQPEHLVASRLKRFMTAMRQVPQRLPSGTPGDWLKCDVHTGQVAFAEYELLADRKLRNDRAKALDTAWSDRYVSRFAFVDVPRFRADVAGWDRFATSVAETLWFHLQRSRRDNVLAQGLANATLDESQSLLEVIEAAVEAATASPSAKPDATGRAVLAVLRERWDDLRELAEEALDDGLLDDGSTGAVRVHR